MDLLESCRFLTRYVTPMISTRQLWALVVALIVVKIALVGWWPFLALTRMPHDVTLFLHQAMSILEGNWLGIYSEKTLMKGPITPIWIALMNFLGVPLLMSHHFFYIAGCVLTLLAFKRFTNNGWFLLFVFTLFLFNPFSYNYGPIASAFREMLQQPVVLTLIALSIILTIDFMKHRTVNIGLSVLFGIILVMFWNNREEGAWVLPYLIWLLLAMVYSIWRDWQPNNAQSLIKLLQLVLIPCAIWGFGTLAIAWKNYQEYEVFAVVELKTSEFRRAFGGLLGIDAEHWRPHYAAQPDVLDKLYALPSGGELNLDNKASGTRQPIHSFQLAWSFRSAVRNSGYYDKGGSAVLEFYNRIGEEIERACAEKRFACSNPLFGVFPPWHSGYTHAFAKNFSKVFSKIIKFGHDLNIEDFHSWGNAQDLLVISRLVNSPVRIAENQQHLLPSFYTRLKKNKTKYQIKLLEFYRGIVPYVFWLAVLGLFSRLILIIKTRRANLLDTVYFGIAGTLLLQLLIFTLLRVTGYSGSTRLYFIFYPVFFTFIGIGLLSLTRDVRNIIASFR